MGLSISFRLKLSLVVLVACVGFTVLGVSAFRALNDISRTAEEVDSAQEAASAIADAQVALLTLANQRAGLSTENHESYVALVVKTRAQHASALENAAERNSLPEVVSTLGELKKGLIDYLDELAIWADKKSQIGMDEDSGLRGELTRAAMKLEAGVEGFSVFSNAIVGIREAEKDFLRSGDPQTSQTFRQHATALKSKISEFGFEDQYGPLMDAYEAAFVPLTARAGELKAVERSLNARLPELKQTGAAAIQQLQERVLPIAKASAEAAAESARTAILGGGVAVAAVLVVLLLWIGVDVTRSLARSIRLLEAVAQGDLSARLGTGAQRGDEFGRLARAVENMRDSMLTRITGVIENIRETASSVEARADEISSGNANLSQRTEAQASSLEETASSMEEMTSTVKQNADNATHAKQLAAGARTQAESGGAVVNSAVAAMGDINDASKHIADIIGVIDEIAFQTNLLALNAAVEAARAGEQGRGFAVVAGEVRSLAQRSADAAKQIKALIVDSVKKVEEGTRLVDASGATLEEIVTAVKKVSDIIAEIAAASNEQSAGIEQVNKAITQMDEVTQQNAALVEEAASASEDMRAKAADLSRILNAFKLSEDDAVAELAPDAEGYPANEPQARLPERRGPDRPWSGDPATVTGDPSRPARVVGGNTGEGWEES